MASPRTTHVSTIIPTGQVVFRNTYEYSYAYMHKQQLINKKEAMNLKENKGYMKENKGGNNVII